MYKKPNQVLKANKQVRNHTVLKTLYNKQSKGICIIQTDERVKVYSTFS